MDVIQAGWKAYAACKRSAAENEDELALMQRCLQQLEAEKPRELELEPLKSQLSAGTKAAAASSIWRRPPFKKISTCGITERKPGTRLCAALEEQIELAPEDREFGSV